VERVSARARDRGLRRAGGGLAALARGIRWWTAVRIPRALETPDGPPGYPEAGARVLGRWVASAMRPGVR
jgi:hypothetical protein